MAFGLGFHIISAPSFASQAIFLPPRFSATAPRLRALHRAEDIGSALKRGVNVCQRQLVNEVLRPLVTEFVRNFSREGATPIQLGPNASLFGRIQVVKLIRHNALRHLMTKRLTPGLPHSCNKHCATLFIPTCYSVSCRPVSSRRAFQPK